MIKFPAVKHFPEIVNISNYSVAFQSFSRKIVVLHICTHYSGKEIREFHINFNEPLC